VDTYQPRFSPSLTNNNNNDNNQSANFFFFYAYLTYTKLFCVPPPSVLKETLIHVLSPYSFAQE